MWSVIMLGVIMLNVVAPWKNGHSLKAIIETIINRFRAISIELTSKD
jgi:hypothetical protein